MRGPLPAKVVAAIEDDLRAAGRGAAAAVGALGAATGARALRAAPVVLAGQRVAPLRRRHPVAVPPVPLHRAQVRTSLHIGPRQLLHVLLVQPLLPLTLRHVQPQHVQETHLHAAQDPAQHARTFHQPIRRHMLDCQKRTDQTSAESQRKQILLSLLDRITDASLAKNSTVIY